ncbi:MAG: DUF4235 domain-containing protein [Solirubrobacteraceae bacterium]
MKLLYKPFSIIAGAIGSKLGQQTFRGVWARFDDGLPPPPTSPEASLPKVVGAAALEGATMAAVAAVVDRASARTFAHLFGAWPNHPADEH